MLGGEPTYEQVDNMVKAKKIALPRVPRNWNRRVGYLNQREYPSEMESDF
jgi:hypothetical protein